MIRITPACVTLLAIAFGLCPSACTQLQPGLEGAGAEATGGSGSDREADDEDPVESNGGSCNDWKVSYCNAVDRCSFDSRDECEWDVGFMYCAEGAPAASCAAKIDAADCDSMPDDCGPEALADRTFPRQACERIYAAICEWSFFCGGELSVDSCLASLDTGAPCSQFTAALHVVDECVNAYQVLACDEPMPAICMGILRH